MQMGERLRELRIELGLSMGEAARALGVTTVRYSSAEHNKGEQLSALELAEVLLRRASVSKHHPELARRAAELERMLAAADACLLNRAASASDKRYARAVADVIAWLVGCPSERAFDVEALR